MHPDDLDDAIDERTSIVSITAVCYRNGVRLPVEEIARCSLARCADGGARRLPGGGLAPARRGDARRGRTRGGRAEVPARIGGVGVYVGAAGASFVSEPDRLVRRRGHLQDRSPDYSPRDCAPLPVGHAAVAGDIRRDRRDRANARYRRRRDAGTSERAQRTVDRRRRRAGGHRDDAREAEVAERWSASARRMLPRLVSELGADGMVTSEATQPAHLRDAYNNEDDIDAVLAACLGIARSSA